ncbi:lp4 protein [Salmonella phage vB_SenM-AKM_NP4]|nr:internal virion protein [Salmonella phage STP4-a]YP_009148109.1 internal virion protein [Salmonella phage STML-198]YP_009286478.1 internal virion protein [Salmonella phage vB_SnwM_CGG4-1]YP_009615601.1 internal virion protein [Salmonella phage Melville]UFK27242.1 hypothetical protein LG358_00221 [Escherichia phage UoN_LG358_1]WDR21784.1 hypothetical protein PJM34_0116 [Salmonella phage vB_SenM_UTK0003]WLI71744.1 lp4 protein [Salmonella phage vB_SenM-AKM_NP4]AFU64067.1 hypothetical protein
MKTYEDFINEARVISQIIINESTDGLLKYKKGQKITVVLEDGTEVDMDVMGYNYVVEGKLYNKSHAKFSSFEDFVSSVDDESVRKALNTGDQRSLMAYGHERIKAKLNKPGEDNFALIGYQAGKQTYGYQRTVTMYNSRGKIAFVNDKGVTRYVKSIK